jgi:hypothetical protein
MYLIKKGDYEFSKIAQNGYEIAENVPVILSKKTMANGNIKIVYASNTNTTIKIKFIGLTGAEMAEYLTNFVDGEYSYWSVKTRAYVSANFIVTHDVVTMATA